MFVTLCCFVLLLFRSSAQKNNNKKCGLVPHATADWLVGFCEAICWRSSEETHANRTQQPIRTEKRFECVFRSENVTTYQMIQFYHTYRIEFLLSWNVQYVLVDPYVQP